jgi:hypothetical protein
VDFLRNDAALADLMRRFEAGTWPVAEFHHAPHLALAVCVILESADPMDRLRTGIRHYNVSQGGANTEDSGYHETLTRFWLDVVRSDMAALPKDLTRREIASRVVEHFSSRRDLFRDYYDFDVLKSREARARWIAPDRPLP